MSLSIYSRTRFHSMSSMPICSDCFFHSEQKLYWKTYGIPSCSYLLTFLLYYDWNDRTRNPAAGSCLVISGVLVTITSFVKAGRWYHCKIFARVLSECSEHICANAVGLLWVGGKLSRFQKLFRDHFFCSIWATLCRSKVMTCLVPHDSNIRALVWNGSGGATTQTKGTQARFWHVNLT